MPLSQTLDFTAGLASAAQTTERQMERLLPRGEGPEARLFEAMHYSAMAPGKRLRAFFTFAGATLFGVSTQAAARVAAAIEFVHTYSLIHDDLPAMDDDDLRRGRPSCHKAFDEATAILAGDALQSLAFEVLAHQDTHGDAAVRVNLVSGLARAIGAHGMCAGQMLDMASAGVELSSAAITRLQRLKTGALIEFACVSGALLGKAAEPSRHALQAYAHDLGLAFQIADDLLDVAGTQQEIGKTPGKDQAAGKANFVQVLGVERARAQAQLLADQAGRHLDLFGRKADLLKQAALFVVERRS